MSIIYLQQRPQVLVLSGLDPSGGAGIQADIQAITALGAHPLPVITCLTVQNTCNVYSATAVDAELIRAQLECLEKDTPIHAVKTGALGNTEIVTVLLEFLSRHPHLPVIVDPVIKAAGGGDLADHALVESMTRQLFNKADVITPNGVELALLGHSDQEAIATAHILESGCPSVLVTGGHGEGPDIINTLYRLETQQKRWTVERVGGEYHGTGCTLAAAIAAGRAAGQPLEQAIEHAQIFVSGAINNALTVGKGQPVPERSMARSSVSV